MEEHEKIAQQGRISVEVIKQLLGDLSFNLCTERSEVLFLREENNKLITERDSLKEIIRNLGKEIDSLKKELKSMKDKQSNDGD